uniref:Glycosyltransferase RgtA/B/C/D-like domain-containing protein n=1 Tax=Caldilinea aerophila TaxID=133453 RepID=A0A7C1FT13_9CHLR
MATSVERGWQMVSAGYRPELWILLLAALTRFWQLDYHSFWFDEAVSLEWARADASYIWQSTFPLVKDKHPPGYYLLLHGWWKALEPVGLTHNEIALRMSGALLGILTVLGVLLLVRRTSGRTTALLAGTLTALSPVLIWYSQELRMFQPATMGVAWAACCLAHAWGSAKAPLRAGWWAGMVVAFTFALYSYLFSAFALPAAGLTLLGLWLAHKLQRGDRAAQAATNRQLSGPTREATPRSLVTSGSSPDRLLLEGVIALAVTGLLFLPLARNAWLVNESEGSPGRIFMDFTSNLLRQVQIFTFWRAPWPEILATTTLIFFGLLALIGLSAPQRKGPDRSAHFQFDQMWLFFWIGTPLLIGNLLLAVSDTVFAEDRYFLFLAPFFLWAVARGAVILGERWRPAAVGTGAVTVLLLAAALPALWSPSLLREDWRAAAQYIAHYQQRSPGLPAAVFVHADYTNIALRWYLHQTLDEKTLPVFYPYTGILKADEAESVVAPPVSGLRDLGVETLWLVQSHLEGVDAARVVQRWLSENFPVITEQYPAGIQVIGYALRHRYEQLPRLGAQTSPLDIELAPHLRLAACEVLTPVLAAQDERLHPPSGWVHVRLWWQATGKIDQAYMPSVQMVGPEGVWGERLYRDGETLRRDPPTQWPVGTVVRDEVDVNLNPATPPGEYPVVVGLRDETGNDVGAKVECGQVRITQR